MAASSVLSWSERLKAERAAVAEAVAAFPSTFGLRAFPGKVFRVNTSGSYYSDTYGVLLYTDIQDTDGSWASFAKGSPKELRSQISR